MSHRYRIDGILGTGGASTVFRAFDLRENRDVALKRVVAANLPSPDDKARAEALLEREYYVLAELSHPSIIRVYDYDVDEEGPYYTMEWLEGRTLTRGAPRTVRAACATMRDIASCLAMLHSRKLLHRDVTANNVFLTDQGTTKLIDFGAMTPWGVPKGIVGTPPFMPPECDGVQMVDGRADLFALGACFYFALTGRHAFPARSMAELPEVWSRGVRWPSQLVPDVPEALEQLILEMLSLSPAGRPASAAEVFERITSIAGLATDEAPAVAHAYLTTPTLTARNDALATVAAHVAAAGTGQGAAIVIGGASGVGRSRMLEATMLEAKVAGFTVLRVDALSGRHVPFALLRSLARVLSDTSRDDGESRVAATVDGGVMLGDASMDATVQRILASTRSRPVALAVDDVHQVDAESLAALALLATFARERPLLLVATLDTSATGPSTGPLATLLSHASQVDLAPFSQDETRSFLASLFGNVPNLEVVSTLAHGCMGGHVRELLRGAQALVDQGLARYVGGAWTLGGDAAAISSTLSRAAGSHLPLETFSPDARDLLSTVALDRDALLSWADYREVVFAGDRARANAALSVLLQASIVGLYDDRILLKRQAHRDSVSASLAPEERRRIHTWLAAWAGRFANPIYRAYHGVLAGSFPDAAEGFTGYRDFADRNPADPLLSRSVVGEAIAPMLDTPTPFNRAFLVDCEAIYVLNSAHRGLPEKAAPRLRHCLGELSWLTGLEDYHDRKALEPAIGLGEVLALSQARCAQSVGIDPVLALRRLCQISIVAAICARHLADPTLLKVIPDLSPFSVLSPAIPIVMHHIEAISAMARGRLWEGRQRTLSVLEELRGPIGERLDPVTRMAIERAALGQLCSFEADHAADDALAHVQELALHLPNAAESCRARYYLASGKVAESDAARAACERLTLHVTGLAETRISELTGYLALYALYDDALGVKRILSAITEVVKTRPAWCHHEALARAHLLRCRGDFRAALSIVEQSVVELDPEHPAWEPLLALRVRLRHLSGDADGAAELGWRTLDLISNQQKPIGSTALHTALAEAHRGHPDLAERSVALALEELEAQRLGGIRLGSAVEVAAQIASIRGDSVAFGERVARCIELYRRVENPALTARCDALLRADARRSARGMYPNAAPSPPEALPESSDALDELLADLVKRTDALGGRLYTLARDEWKVTSEAGQVALSPEAEAVVRDHLFEHDEPSTAFGDSTEPERTLEQRTWQFQIDPARKLLSFQLEVERPLLALLVIRADARDSGLDFGDHRPTGA